jgi:hypothetical protein
MRRQGLLPAEIRALTESLDAKTNENEPAA